MRVYTGDFERATRRTFEAYGPTIEDEYEVSHVVKGDSIHEVLSYVEYEPSVMVERMRLQAERAKREGRITVDPLQTRLRAALGRG